MQAVLSGRAGVALWKDGDTWNSIHYDQIDQLVPRDPEEIELLFRGADDLDWIEVNSADEVRDRLADAVDSTEALNLVLYLCDDRLTAETLSAAAQELEELIVHPEIVAALEQVLFAAPLPPSSNLDPGLAACIATDSNATVTFLERLLDLQPAVETVRMAWHAIPPERFDENDRRYTESICVRYGLFRDLVNEFATSNAVVNTQFTVAKNVELRQQFPNINGVLNSWVQAISGGAKPRIQESDEPEERVAAASIRRRSHDRTKTLAKIQSQKKLIAEALAQHDSHRAWRLVEELIEFQTAVSSTSQICQSLCDLAVIAQDLGHFEFQCRLTSRCIQMKADDAWSWTQHGKGLLNLGHYTHALEAYDQAVDFSKRSEDNAVARNGRAEVLKAMGRLEDALTEYDSVRQEHPSNVVARIGRAQVLKAMGRLEDALTEYDAVRQEHPTNVVARNGRAEVLKAMGRHEVALAEYDGIRQEHPTDVVARTGRAEVLKSMGRLEDALTEYDGVRKDHPTDVVARNGRAEALKAMGRLDGALAEYDGVRQEHPTDVVTRNGRAEVLKAMGRLEDALAEYDGVRQEHPTNVVARTGRAQVLKVMGRLEDALAEYDRVRQEHPTDILARTGRAEVLKAMGRLEDALAEYESVCKEHPTNVIARTGRAQILFLMRRYDDALQELPARQPSTASDWIGFHIRGMILLRLGNADEAVRIFEEGMERNPFVADRDYFCTALTVAKLQQRRFDDALNVLSRIARKPARVSANVLRTHIYGELKNFDAAAEAAKAWPDPRNRSDADIFGELKRRYVDQLPPAHDDDWLLDAEIRFVMQAA